MSRGLHPRSSSKALSCKMSGIPPSPSLVASVCRLMSTIAAFKRQEARLTADFIYFSDVSWQMSQSLKFFRGLKTPDQVQAQHQHRREGIEVFRKWSVILYILLKYFIFQLKLNVTTSILCLALICLFLDNSPSLILTSKFMKERR